MSAIVKSVQGEVVESPARSMFVRERLVAINRDMSEKYIENGLLLLELKTNGYYREWGYESFDECIEHMHQQGLVDYGSRNARNFIAVAEMIGRLELSAEDVQKIAISKLREIASLPSPESQRKMLDAAQTMSVDDVQREAKKIRDQAAGRDVDPLRPYTFMMTDTQHTFTRECLTDARRVYSIDDEVSDANVLVDVLLADWKSGLPEVEAQEIEAHLG